MGVREGNMAHIGGEKQCVQNCSQHNRRRDLGTDRTALKMSVCACARVD